jgi:ferrous iron transport protein A
VDLRDALPDATVRLLRLSGAPLLRERLAALGLTPGQRIAVLRRAPLGGTTEVLVRGYRLAVREDEAACLLVEPA